MAANGKGRKKNGDRRLSDVLSDERTGRGRSGMMGCRKENRRDAVRGGERGRNRIIGDIDGNSRRNRCVSDADAVINNGAINLAAKDAQYPLESLGGDTPIGS